MRNRRRSLKKASLKVVEGSLIRGAALLHYTSEAERDEAGRAGVQAPCIVLPNPISHSPAVRCKGVFRAMQPQLAGKNILLFLSRIDRKKGLELLLDSFAALRPSHSGLHLVIAGSGDPDYVDALKARARQLEIADQIHWSGFVSGELKNAILADANVFVLPSYSENFGNAVAEALAAGLPVIVSENVGIHREITRAGAGLVVPCEAKPLSEAIRRFFSTPELPTRMSAAAVQLGENAFPTGSIIRRLKACYEDVLRDSRTAPGLKHAELLP